MSNTRRIYITGVMGSGKTSVAKELASLYAGYFYSENINSSRLEKAFSGNESISTLNQLDLLLDIVKAHDYKLLNNTQVFDTSLFTNLFFSDILIPKKDRDTYKNVWDTASELCTSDNEYNIFLAIDYDTMISRIESRGRDFEKETDFDYKDYYLKFTDSMANIMIRNRLDRKFILINNYDLESPKEIAKIIYDKITEVENGSI